jgi:hypothetical protein
MRLEKRLKDPAAVAAVTVTAVADLVASDLVGPVVRAGPGAREGRDESVRPVRTTISSPSRL